MLTGFVLGSLLIIWPWKITLTEERILPGGEVKVAETGYEWLLPQINQDFAIALALIVLDVVVDPMVFTVNNTEPVVLAVVNNVINREGLRIVGGVRQRVVVRRPSVRG